MNTPDAAAASPSIRVWDLPTRVFHWSLVICFAGAWLTSESERQALLHLLFGYSLFGLILFRLVWGVVGSRYARFSQFVRGPQAIARYLRSLWRRQPEHSVGHNPAGAVGVLLLLGLGLATAFTGWLMVSGAGESLEDLHEGLATAMLVLVFVHIAAVVVSSWLHRENLTRAMITGRKRGEAQEGIAKNAVVTGALLLAALAAFWGYGLSQNQVPLGLAGTGGMDEESHAAGGEYDEEGDEEDEHDGDRAGGRGDERGEQHGD